MRGDAIPTWCTMTRTYPWIGRASQRLFGWKSVDATLLSGSSEDAIVVRVRHRCESVILKKYKLASFPGTSLSDRLVISPFAKTLGMISCEGVVAYEDLGDHLLGDELRSSSYEKRCDLGLRYVQLVAEAHRVLVEVGAPGIPDADAPVFKQLGLPRPTQQSRDITSLVSVLRTISKSIGCTRLDSDTLRCAGSADRKAQWWSRCARNADNRYIVGDTNPYNVIRTSCGRYMLVDVDVDEGVADTDLLPLGGLIFDLELEDINTIWSTSESKSLDVRSWWTLNGYFSVISLCDTIVGLERRTRDGTQGLDVQSIVFHSLERSVKYLERGMEFGTGWIGAINQLRSHVG